MVMSKTVQHRFKYVLAGCCLIGLMLSTFSAHAFRPSSRWLLDQVAARQISRQSKPLKVVSEEMLFGRAGAPKGIAAKGQVWIFPPDSMRRETRHADQQETLVRNASKEMVLDSAKGSNGVVKSKLRPHLIWDFLSMGKPLERKTAAVKLTEAAKHHGVDVDRVSYARFDGRVNYLIGSKGWEQEKSQLWIDKETFLVTRLVVHQKKADGTALKMDYRLLGWGSAEGGNWYPKIIEIWQNDALTHRSVTRQVDRVVALDRALFEIR